MLRPNAEREELKLAQEKHELLSREQVNLAWAEKVNIVKNKILSIPELAPLLINHWGELQYGVMPYALFQVPGSAAYYPGMNRNWTQEFKLPTTRDPAYDHPNHAIHAIFAHFVLNP